MHLSIILYMVNRNNVIIHFHDEELMNPKKCAPFFNRKEHTDLTAFYETLERNYPKRMTFNEAVQFQSKIAYLVFHGVLSAINWNEWNW